MFIVIKAEGEVGGCELRVKLASFYCPDLTGMQKMRSVSHSGTHHVVFQLNLRSHVYFDLSSFGDPVYPLFKPSSGAVHNVIKLT